MRTDALFAACLALALALPPGLSPVASAQQRQEEPPAERAEAPAFESAEQVLAALETAGEALRTFTSGIRYTTIQELGGALTQRVGEIAFASDTAADGSAKRRFAVHFTSLRRGERLLNDQSAWQTIAFDGRWLWEKLYGDRQINKREIVRQGETIDPFELGDGPFPPLPIGQQKDDILARYRVELVPWAQSLTPDPELDPRFADEKLEIDMANALMALARGSVQLRLVPRDRDGRFSEIRLWYKPDAGGRLLPRMSRTVDANSGNIAIVELLHPLTVNGPAREDLLTVSPDADQQDAWNITETRLPPAPAQQPGGTTRTSPRDRP